MQSEPTSRELWDASIGSGIEYACTGCAGVGRQYNRWLYRVRAARFRAFVRRSGIDPARLNILDAGSGTGFYIDQWKQLGASRLQALDFSQASVDWLRRRYPGLPVHQQDLASPRPNLPEGPFDVISAIDVLFHIVDDDDYSRALANLAAWLKPGGILLLSENFVHRERERTSRYHFSRTLDQVSRLLAQQGLQLEQRQAVFALMNAPDDSTYPLLLGWWRLLNRVIRRGEIPGWLAGASLYWPERLITGWLREGPSTEYALCRKYAPEP